MRFPNELSSGRLEFHRPGKPGFDTLHLDDLETLYFQLVLWCNIQRYWYYVVGLPKVTDLKYDKIERFIGDLRDLVKARSTHDPTDHAGSDCVTPEAYLPAVIQMFQE